MFGVRAEAASGFHTITTQIQVYHQKIRKGGRNSGASDTGECGSSRDHLCLSVHESNGAEKPANTRIASRRSRLNRGREANGGSEEGCRRAREDEDEDGGIRT